MFPLHAATVLSVYNAVAKVPLLLHAAGLNPDVHGLQLALRLLRPLLILAAISAYRCCFSLGTLHRQLQRRAMSEAALVARRWVPPACRDLAARPAG